MGLSWAVLNMEMETEDIFGVKLPNELLPCVRQSLRVDDSCDSVARKPKFVLRYRGAGKTGPSSRDGLIEVSVAITFTSRTKLYTLIEALMI